MSAYRDPAPPDDVDDAPSFPAEVLPETLWEFVTATADALRCDPGFVALPALACCAGAIGTARAIELKESWHELPIVRCAVVARSGTLKSPALDAALAPLREAQADALAAHAAAMQTYELERAALESDLARWKKAREGEPPTAPTPPTARRYVVTDCTVEALGVVLSENARGVLLARDELSGWVSGFDQYRPRGRGGDVAAWPEMFRGGPLLVDRKFGQPRTLHIPRAACGVVGGIQPDRLCDRMSPEYIDCGLQARLLVAAPPTWPKRWSNRVPSARVRGEYHRLIGELLHLEHDQTEHGAEPKLVMLAPEAKLVWSAWYDQHADRTHAAASDADAAILAKVECYAARLSLVLALAADPLARGISADVLRRSLALAEWFAVQAEHVYADQRADEAAGALDGVARIVRARGGRVTVRKLTHAAYRFRERGAAELALEALVAARRGAWQYPRPGPAHGQPARCFMLVDAPPPDRNGRPQADDDDRLDDDDDADLDPRHRDDDDDEP
jgi:hypothetical protein